MGHRSKINSTTYLQNARLFSKNTYIFQRVVSVRNNSPPYTTIPVNWPQVLIFSVIQAHTVPVVLINSQLVIKLCSLCSSSAIVSRKKTIARGFHNMKISKGFSLLSLLDGSDVGGLCKLCCELSVLQPAHLISNRYCHYILILLVFFCIAFKSHHHPREWSHHGGRLNLYT